MADVGDSLTGVLLDFGIDYAQLELEVPRDGRGVWDLSVKYHQSSIEGDVVVEPRRLCVIDLLELK